MQAAQNTAQIFLGINLKCASCHDSFINRYKLRESYGMAALFSPDSRLELVRCDAKTGKYTGPQLLYPDFGAVPRDTRFELALPGLGSARRDRARAFRFDELDTARIGKGFFCRVDDLDQRSMRP